uniref:Uncharacterized protein n=1 Tax=Anguilla anguilla TaxID=7936 RepID=A0A0E9PJT5_ANGAN
MFSLSHLNNILNSVHLATIQIFIYSDTQPQQRDLFKLRERNISACKGQIIRSGLRTNVAQVYGSAVCRSPLPRSRSRYRT